VHNPHSTSVKQLFALQNIDGVRPSPNKAQLTSLADIGKHSRLTGTLQDARLFGITNNFSASGYWLLAITTDMRTRYTGSNNGIKCEEHMKTNKEANLFLVNLSVGYRVPVSFSTSCSQ
jgi:hypothetical protein